MDRVSDSRAVCHQELVAPIELRQGGLCPRRSTIAAGKRALVRSSAAVRFLHPRLQCRQGLLQRFLGLPLLHHEALLVQEARHDGGQGGGASPGEA